MNSVAQTAASSSKGFPLQEPTADGQSVKTRPLFRPEALDHHRHKLYGEIILIRPVGLAFLAWVAVAFIAGAITFLICGHYTNKAHVSGVLLPDTGLIKLYAPQAGTVTACHVREGQQVQKGDVLFELSSDRSSLALRSTETEVRLALLNRRQSLLQERAGTLLLNQQQATHLHGRLEMIRQEQEQLATEIATTSTKLALAERTLNRYRQMWDAHLLSDMQLQEKEAEPLEQKKALQELERTKVGLESEAKDVNAELEKLPYQTQVQSATLERSIFEIDSQLSELEASRAGVVRAPEDGMVSAIMAGSGVTVQPASVLATLVPGQAKLEAHLYAPSRAVGFIKPGEQVLLRYQAYPSEKFGHQAGIVSEVSRVALDPAEYALRTGGTVQEPMYEITVSLPEQTITLYGQPHALQAEMAIEADILLDRRRLIEWVFEPLLGLKGRLGG